jgi:polyhydroxyalkanoate synthesis regulator phasin
MILNFFDDIFLIGIGYLSEMKNKLEDLINKGKITQEETQLMFDKLDSNQKLHEHMNPLTMSYGFSVYLGRRLLNLIDELQRKGKISALEAKKYHEQYIHDISEKKEDSIRIALMKKSDLKILIQKLDTIEKLIPLNEKKKGEDTK